MSLNLNRLGEYRMQALMRLWAFAWALTFGALVSLIFGTLAFIWGIVDVALELLFNRDALSTENTAAMWTSRSLTWMHEQSMFVLLGAGEFEWLP